MELDAGIRVLVAAVLAVPIGLDRELRGKAAGLRTHVMVAAAAAALGAVSLAVAPASASGADGTRIASQVVTGIGFMGAGVIFASGGRVHGLTTAAALFSAAAVGLCAGLGEVGLAAVLVVVTILFLWPVDLVSQRLLGGFALEERLFQVVARDLATLTRVQEVMADAGVTAREVDVDVAGTVVAARIVVRCRRATALGLSRRLTELDGIGFVSDEAFAQTD